MHFKKVKYRRQLRHMVYALITMSLRRLPFFFIAYIVLLWITDFPLLDVSSPPVLLQLL
jgi:hypothetical protein